jgi:pimeloyl-ACP methyl ester carboxylesterase
MPAVFVHGVPDTFRVWASVQRHLTRTDVVTLSLPGFGSSVADDFPATKEAYVDWLLAELHDIGPPIDLIGHDWGALLVLRSLSLAPDIARSWAVGAAPLDADYTWHEIARLWQTPGVGEQVMEHFTGATVVNRLADRGVPLAEAQVAASYIDQIMKDCILRLYRSAVNVGAEWQDGLDQIRAPGLIIWGEDDPFVAPVFGQRLAQRVRARFVGFKDCGHWWQCQRPADVARELQTFWATLAP